MRKVKLKIKFVNNVTKITCYNENNTLGNILQYFMKFNGLIDVCGYHIPHPSEKIMKFFYSTKYQINNHLLNLWLFNTIYIFFFIILSIFELNINETERI